MGSDRHPTILPPPMPDADESLPSRIPPPPSWGARPASPGPRGIATQLRAVLSAHLAGRLDAYTDGLRALSLGASHLSQAEVLLLVEQAEGTEAVELVARIAGRWTHHHDPSERARRLLGATLRKKLQITRVDLTSLACSLAIDPHPEAWLALAKRSREPRFLHFGIVRAELRRRHGALLDTLRAATELTRGASATVGWEPLVAAMKDRVAPCECAECSGAIERGESSSRLLARPDPLSAS